LGIFWRGGRATSRKFKDELSVDVLLLVGCAWGPPLIAAIGGIISSLASQRDRCAVFASSAIAREDGSGVTWRLVMALRIICMCGYVIQGDNDDELWRNAQGHMGVLHPELVGNVTREDLLAQAEQL
jgi:hypothetical protein